MVFFVSQQSPQHKSPGGLVFCSQAQDRLCIAQHDVALKEQGIRGLGSFLAKSQNLTILWSGRYFSRLSLGLDTGMGQRYVVSPITFVNAKLVKITPITIWIGDMNII